MPATQPRSVPARRRDIHTFSPRLARQRRGARRRGHFRCRRGMPRAACAIGWRVAASHAAFRRMSASLVRYDIAAPMMAPITIHRNADFASHAITGLQPTFSTMPRRPGHAVISLQDGLSTAFFRCHRALLLAKKPATAPCQLISAVRACRRDRAQFEHYI